MDWLYLQNGEQKGPVAQEALVALLAQGALPANSHVWREGMAEWAEANQLPVFQVARPEVKVAKAPQAAFRNQSKFEGFRTYTVGGFTYLMAYFEAKFVGSGSVGAVADQFTQFVSNYAAEGFEFFRCDEVPFRVTPGCLAGLFGAKESYGHCTIVTFRKKVD